jgi:hypothetical protein
MRFLKKIIYNIRRICISMHICYIFPFTMSPYLHEENRHTMNIYLHIYSRSLKSTISSKVLIIAIWVIICILLHFCFRGFQGSLDADQYF